LIVRDKINHKIPKINKKREDRHNAAAATLRLDNLPGRHYILFMKIIFLFSGGFMKLNGFAAAILVVMFFSVSPGLAEEKQFVAKIDQDGVQGVQMVGGSYFFDPNRVVVKVNVPVEITIRKEPGVTPHDIMLKAPEAGINFSEDIGTEPVVIKFTPTKTGEYSFYCGKKFPFVKSHRERGMEGVLVVTP
jgi:plastocyanin